MTEKTERQLNIWGQICSIGAVIVSGVIAVLIVWNSANNVSKSEFQEYTDAQAAVVEGLKSNLSGINTSIQVITTKMENDARQDARIDDHEQRLRAVERARR
jgi:fucose permease